MKNVAEVVRLNYRNKVLTHRLAHGFKTQKEFAEKVGISPSIICAIESNERFLSSPYALRICEVLDCKMEDLFEKKS